MRKLAVITAFILATSIFSFGQTDAAPSCPSISISGPAGIIPPNGVAHYTAAVDTKGKNLDLKYFWTAAAGNIISGQGSASIEVNQAELGNTVTVEIEGPPNRCPDTASESYSIDLPSQPLKLAQFDGRNYEADKTELDEIARIAKDNPNNQLYIFFAYRKGTSENEVRKREQRLIDYLRVAVPEQNGDRNRTTIVRYPGSVDLVQFWRIPPGADNPMCRECEESKCPTISVTAPAGIVEPGEPGRYTAQVSGKGDVSNLKYEWSVTAGKIVKGQGTTAIDVVYSDFTKVVATVTVKGLPTDCSNTASETYEISVDPGPIQLGEISGRSYIIDKKLLKTMEKALREHPNAQLYVALQFERGAAADFMRRIRTRVTKQLKTTRIDESRFTFVMVDNGNKNSLFWLILPGVDNPYIDK